MHFNWFAIKYCACQAGQRLAGTLTEIMKLHEEIVISNDINQRVYCAVQTREASANLMRNIDIAEASVANPILFRNPGFQIKISKHMVGDETDGEQYHQNHDQFQTPLLQHWVNVGFCGKNKNNMSITEQNDNQWYGKPCDAPANAVRQVISDPVVGSCVKTRVW